MCVCVLWLTLFANLFHPYVFKFGFVGEFLQSMNILSLFFFIIIKKYLGQVGELLLLCFIHTY
ncbi:unnamed protein product [Brassica napus]|uniref:(rape) hypothetical protein n=1 Tax=Brassica napus TaxID=3708 RepID=A0A816JCT3_BRANA|nr:unnamed protein product [Brassica napus]